MIRAIDRIIYRWFNDGDMFFYGYGCETVGSAMTFLKYYHLIDDGVQLKIKQLIRPLTDETEEDKYENTIYNVAEIILDYVENSVIIKSDYDMFESESEWVDEDDDDDDCEWY